MEPALIVMTRSTRPVPLIPVVAEPIHVRSSFRVQLMNRVIDILSAILLRPFRPKRSEALAAVNRARICLGMLPISELPRGSRGSIESCPLSLVLPGVIGANGIAFENQEDALSVSAAWRTPIEIGGRGRMIVVLPSILQHFVRDFDLGAYPSLVRKPSRRSYSERRAADIQPLQRARTLGSRDDRRAA